MRDGLILLLLSHEQQKRAYLRRTLPAQQSGLGSIVSRTRNRRFGDDRRNNLTLHFVPGAPITIPGQWAQPPPTQPYRRQSPANGQTTASLKIPARQPLFSIPFTPSITLHAMPPVFIQALRRSFDAAEPSREFSSQWSNPGDVFSVLLILGGDVVARALAQLTGSRITPVAFSFGTPTT